MVCFVLEGDTELVNLTDPWYVGDYRVGRFGYKLGWLYSTVGQHNSAVSWVPGTEDGSASNLTKNCGPRAWIRGVCDKYCLKVFHYENSIMIESENS